MTKTVSGGHERDERYLSYVVRGVEVQPAEISTATGLAPDRYWQLGDVLPITGRRSSDALWAIHSGLTPADELHDHVEALLARMRPAWDVFVQLGQEHKATMEGSIHCQEAQGPLVILLPSMLTALGQLNVELGFDLFCLGRREADGDRT